MRSADVALCGILLGLLLSSCGKSGTPSGAGGCPAANTSCTDASGANRIPTSGTSSVPVYIADASATGQWGFPNEPLVSVEICSPNHTSESQCQVISNILLDTGSYGLRVFGSAISNAGVQLEQQSITVHGERMNLAECAVFGTAADWGAVERADVVLGGQTAKDIPIQVINSGFASIPSSCSDLCADTDPCTAGYNGVLGVGPFAQDCGTRCSDHNDDQANPGTYYGCDGTGCFDAYDGPCGGDGTCVFQVPLGEQVLNPVAAFPSGSDNGVSLTLPSIGSSGSSGITGTLALGIGSPSSVQVYPADPNGMADGNGMDFSTAFAGSDYGFGSFDGSIAFMDSGSNGIYFPGNLSPCDSGNGFYCPSSTQSLSATIAGYDGSPTYNASFSIADAESLFGSGLSAFDNIGGPSSRMFDWGLPFFYGRTVYVGLDGMSAKLNGASVQGPYWAF